MPSQFFDETTELMQNWLMSFRRGIRPLLWAATLIILAGCSTVSRSNPPANSPGKRRSPRRDETAVLFVTGNLQGSLLPSRPDQGGAALLQAYYRIVRDELGSRVIWVDAGNLRGKPPEYGYDQGKLFEKFLAQSGLRVTLESSPYRIVEAGPLQIGFITGESVSEVRKRAALARNDGADLVVWVSDLAIRCGPELTRTGPRIRRPGTPDGFCEGKLDEIASRLPEGTLNAILTSGGDRPLDQFIYPRYSSDPDAGIPVVECAPFGKDIQLIDLTYDPVNHAPVFAKTRLEGPIPVRGNARFHGRTVRPDRKVLAIAAPAESWLAAQNRITLAQTHEILAANAKGESAFADLVADAIRKGTHSDFALIDPGLVKHARGRTALRPGWITAADLDRALPADSSVVVLTIKGKVLKTLVRVSESGDRGFAAVSGLRLRLIRADERAPLQDLDGKPQLSLWEQNRILSMTTWHGQRIRAHRTYRLAVPEYLVAGGDDWGWVSRHFDLARRIDVSRPPASARALVKSYLKRLKSIGSVPSRMTFVSRWSRFRHHLKHPKHERRFHGRRRSHRRPEPRG